MKHRFFLKLWKSSSVILILIGSLSLIGCYSQEEYDGKVAEANKYKEELDQKEDALRTLQNEFDELKNANVGATDQTQQIENLQQQLEEATARAQSWQEEKTQFETQISELQGRLKEADQGKVQLDQQREMLDQLKIALRKELESQKIKILEMKDRTIVRLQDRVLFAPGNSNLKKSGSELLQSVGKSLQKLKGRDIQIEGHTDDQPLMSPESMEKYGNNLNLSIARATSVAKFLSDNFKGLDKQISVAGYGPHKPVASNRTRKGRQSNRRVELTIMVPVEPQG